MSTGKTRWSGIQREWKFSSSSFPKTEVEYAKRAIAEKSPTFCSLVFVPCALQVSGWKTVGEKHLLDCLWIIFPCPAGLLDEIDEQVGKKQGGGEEIEGIDQSPCIGDPPSQDRG